MHWIGGNLRAARKARGWSQKTLVKKIEERFGKDDAISQTYISQLERNEREDPTQAVLEKLETVLGVNWQDFYDSNIRYSMDLLPPEMSDDPELIKWLRKSKNIPKVKLAKNYDESGAPEELIRQIMETWRKNMR